MRIETRDQVQFSHNRGHKNHGHQHGSRNENSWGSDSVQIKQQGQTQPKFEINSAYSSNSAAPADVRLQNYYDSQSDQVASKAYYGGGAELFDGLNGAQLFDKLSAVVTSTHRPLKYDPDTYLYPQVDRHPDGNLYCIYSDGGPMFTGDGNHGEAPMKGGYNCEHVVPQSWFQKKSTPRGDLHHLFAAQEHCNSVRGNSLLEDFSGSGYQMVDHGELNQSKNEFNPHGGRGDVARATLYFLMRYPGMIGDGSNEYSPQDIPHLVKWAQNDPPTEYEKHRNQQIQKLQGNRNPLIDFPELVGKIDFSRGMGHC